jgi:phosphoribosylformylglycinamidine cyclo-ligase
MTTQGLTYAKAGVSIEAGDELVRRIGPIAQKTKLPGVLAGVGGFSALFELKSRAYRHPVLVASTDGVGTKLKIAFMSGVHDTIGIDLVAMGVNDILTQGAQPLFFLDYFVCGKLDVTIAEAVVRGVAAGCRQAGCALIGGETAEHPGDFPEGEYDLAGFVIGVLEKKKIIDPAKIVAGDILLGLPSSGLHSNGYSLARKVLLEKGHMKIRQHIPDLGRTLAEELLEPTRIYAKITRKLFTKYQIKGAAHITGGGITGKIGGVAQDEMDRTFNNGLGMIFIVGKKQADAVMHTIAGIGEKCFVIGEILSGARGATIRA